jgi:parvulin-like peptidyl-prolyl isomerase
MKQRFKNAIGALILLATGFTIWKMFSKPLPTPDTMPDMGAQTSNTPEKGQDFQEVEIGGTTVFPGDFQWELELHIKVPKFEDSEDYFSVPKAKKNEPEPVVAVTDSPELRERIVSSVIERKVLYLFIKDKTRGFDLGDPSRFSKCLVEVQDVAKTNPDFFESAQSRERLKAKICEESIIQQYLDEQVFRPLEVSESEMASYYRTHEKSYRKPTRVLLRQIVVAKEDLANELRKVAKQSNFSELARKNSITPEAEKGGLIGPFSKEQLPTLFDIVFSMNMGEISGVIKSEYGYHIIMPVQKLPPQTISLAEAAPEIRAELLRTKRLEAFQRWLNTAMNAISVSSPNTGLLQ